MAQRPHHHALPHGDALAHDRGRDPRPLAGGSATPATSDIGPAATTRTAATQATAPPTTPRLRLLPEQRSSMSDSEHPALADLGRWAENRLPRLIDETLAAVLERVELYRIDDLVPPEDLRRSVTHNLTFMVRAISDPYAPLDFAAPRETGRRRALQGVPLPEVLQVFRIGFARLWEALVEEARARDAVATLDALLDAAGMIWVFTDQHALALTDSYRSVTAELVVAQEHRRSALVEVLLDGQPGAYGGPWEAGKLLGLPPDADLVVVAAETRGLAEATLPRIERALADRGIVSAWRLTPAYQVGVVSLQPAEREAVLQAVRDVAVARVGVSPLYTALRDTPRALHLARVALASIPRGRVDVRVFEASPLAALVACEPDEGRRLAQLVLGPVLDVAEDDRTVLLDTLYAYLDNDGSAERAAAQLYCHANTVRYRLRRIHQLTGRSLSSPRDLAEVASAAFALRIGLDSSPPDRAVGSVGGL